MLQHAKLTRSLLQAGAPNHEILLAKDVPELLRVAQRHNIPVPEEFADAVLQEFAEAAQLMASSANSVGQVAAQLAALHSSPSAASETGADTDGGPPSSSRSGSGAYEGERNEFGEWEGHGRYRFADGTEYVGEWVANQQHGRGTMRYASGASYVGEWRAGQKHGTGTYNWADGRVEIGTYDKDQSVGEVYVSPAS